MLRWLIAAALVLLCSTECRADCYEWGVTGYGVTKRQACIRTTPNDAEKAAQLQRDKQQAQQQADSDKAEAKLQRPYRPGQTTILNYGAGPTISIDDLEQRVRDLENWMGDDQ